jgi:hypothetical protein
MTKAREESEEQREARLIKAKKQAAKSREEKMVEKYKDKVLEKVGGRPKRDEDKASANRPVRDESEDEDEDDEAPKKPLKLVKPIKEEVTEEVKEEEEKPKQKIKSKAKAKAKVIIEQSSDDEDTFEASKDVIFVKRVRAKPKVEQQHAPMPPSVATNPVTRQEQPLPQKHCDNRFQQQQQQQQAPPPKPQISQEKRLEMERYLNMTRGNFLPMSRPR